MLPGSDSLPKQLHARYIEHKHGSNVFKLPPYIILVLYAGKADNSSLAAAIQQTAPWLTPYVVEIEIMRDEHHDMLAMEPYSSLLTAATEGRILAVIGGPNCRTWTVLRHRPKPGGGRPIRGRSEPECWGLPTNTASEQSKVDDDTTLLTRQLHIYQVAAASSLHTVYFFLEHPADPAHSSTIPGAAQCCTIWILQLILYFMTVFRMTIYTFDQCMLGHLVSKTTSAMTNFDLPGLQELWCQHENNHRDIRVEDSSSLSRWAWGLNIMLAQALSSVCSWLHTSNLEVPQHSDRAQGSPYSVRPTPSQPGAPEIVTIGFKHRPIRDGGGKPSLGRYRPGHRSPATLAAMGASIIASSQGELLQDVRVSILSNDTQQPATIQALQRIRAIMSPQKFRTEPADGQPFYLEVLSDMAWQANDPDYLYPLSVRNGVPLGVEEMTWTSPGIWPTKQELSGITMEDEVHPPPFDQPNYSSATEHEDILEQTYMEERDLGMTLGPFT